MSKLTVGVSLLFLGCATVAVNSYQARNAGPDAGVVRLIKSTSPAFDNYTSSTSPVVQQWLREHFPRMLVHSPYFDQKTSWYPGALLYYDLYAVYRDNPTAGVYIPTEHPEWILRDAAGNPLYIPWGCDASAHSCPQYAGDVTNAGFRQFWLETARRNLERGQYKGLMIDDVNLEWRVGNGDGKFVAPIDPTTGLPMTLDNWRRHMADFVEQIRRYFPDIEILHNSLWFAGGDAGAADPNVHRQINAADYIFIEGGVNDSNLKGGTGFWSLRSLLGFVDQVNAYGRKVMIGNLGGSNPNPATVEYAVACYYLVSNGNDYIGDKSAVSPDTWYPVLDTNLGQPLGGRFLWNNLLRRNYQGGFVLVNEPHSAGVTIKLPSPMGRADGTQVTSVALSAGQGAVLTYARH